MTNQERLQSLLGHYPADSNAILGAMIDAGVVAADTYTLANYTPIRIALLDLLRRIFSTPDTGNSDPSFSIKYDREALRKYISDLEQEVAPEDAALPTIKAVCRW